MRKMEQVTRYKCAWCGKEFKTPNRHLCKWDPDSHNCLSCVYRGEFVKGEPTRQTGIDSWEEGYPAEFECFALMALEDGMNFNRLPGQAQSIANGIVQVIK